VIGSADFASVAMTSANSVLDSCSIDAASFASRVPAPGTLSLVGLLGVGLLIRRRNPIMRRPPAMTPTAR
jgi:hypothetical protein